MATNNSPLILPATPVGTNGLTVTADIRGLKEPVKIPSGWVWLWWTLGAVLLLLLAWWAWKKWRRKKIEIQKGKVIPPHEKARKQLEKALGLLDQPRPFCILVSDTIRVYLEERFNLHAPERTTEEFLEELQSSAALELKHKQMLGDFLMRCDLVKFARAEPPARELQELYESALRLISETEPAPELPNVGQHVDYKTSDKS